MRVFNIITNKRKESYNKSTKETKWNQLKKIEGMEKDIPCKWK